MVRGTDRQEPNLTLGHFSLWIQGRSCPDSNDFWDGNWLQSKVRVEASGAKIEIVGTFLRNTELLGFMQSVSRMSDKVAGTAELRCIEPNLGMVLAMDRLGHVDVKVSITPDHLTQSHNFSFMVDQTFLPPIVRACGRILERFPIMGKR